MKQMQLYCIISSCVSPCPRSEMKLTQNNLPKCIDVAIHSWYDERVKGNERGIPNEAEATHKESGSRARFKLAGILLGYC